jgi:hypothetical protein
MRYTQLLVFVCHTKHWQLWLETVILAYVVYSLKCHYLWGTDINWNMLFQHQQETVIFAACLILGECNQRFKWYVAYFGWWGWCVGTGNIYKILLGKSLKSIYLQYQRDWSLRNRVRGYDVNWIEIGWVYIQWWAGVLAVLKLQDVLSESYLIVG